MSGHDRVTFNEPDNWLGPAFALGAVDEIVLSNAAVHLEMLGDSTAYLAAGNADREILARIHARATTRAQRRQVLAHSDDRLRDHLADLLPRSGMRWAIPAWRRPWSVLCAWWAARDAARSVLVVTLDEDSEVGP